MIAVDFRPPTVSIALVSIEDARAMVDTARALIARMDGKTVSGDEIQTILDDALDLAFYVAGTSAHLDARTAERRARVLAGW